MEQVIVGAMPLDVLEPVLGESRFRGFADVASKAAAALHGRAVVNVNSTATGGGVAEMLPTLLAYARGVDIDVRWLVIYGGADFFTVTKRVHNNIYGVHGDGGELGRAQRRLYEKTLQPQVEDLLTMVQPSDVVILHDPQTLGLAPMLRRARVPVVWRCHIGADGTNDYTERGWRFLAPYLEAVDLLVVSRKSFAPPGFPADRVVVIPPSVDPLAVKNVDLDAATVDRLLAYTGLIQGRNGGPPTYQRRDGSPARVDRQADVLQLGPPPPPDAPLVVQVSRWDALKDMAGVLTAFAEHVDGTTDAHLLLVGPNVTGVADDPESVAVFEDCSERWRALPHAERRRVHLACLPTADTEENAVIVNALQRRATVVAQKSLAEGFGLTVIEAMWKNKPVVASAVGGIVDQITDDGCGSLIEDPHDLAAFGAAVRRLLDDPELPAKIGAAAHERAREFLPDVHLTRWAELLTSLPRAD
ncbi:MAG TPA: glycosyltransferase [Mycobacteriales bacterium]|nr:glycosyltransferase [Mycobacteriales bacterium]